MDNTENPYAANASISNSRAIANSRVMLWGCAATAIVLLLAATISVAFVLGGISSDLRRYKERAKEDASDVREFFAQHPERFHEVEIVASSDGWTHLSGSVNSQSELDLLTHGMQRLFGEKRGEEMTVNIEVSDLAAAVDSSLGRQPQV